MKNIPEFEGLRGILSTLVVIAHIYSPLEGWVWGSMDIFFCISGLLIGRQILRGRSRPGFLRRYAWRRITRIWLPYYVTFAACLLVAAVMASFFPHPRLWPPGLGDGLTFLFLQYVELLFHPLPSQPSYYLTDYLPWMAHTWSVALEEQFYVLAPLLCAGFSATRRPTVAAGIFAVAMIVSSCWLRVRGLDQAVLPARFDAFATGLFVATLPLASASDRLFHSVKVVAISSAFTIVALFVAYPPTPGDPQTLTLRVYGIGAFAIFAASALSLVVMRSGHPSMALLRSSIFMGLGRMSYSTYLAHIPTLWYIKTATASWSDMDVWKTIPLQIVLCYGAAFSFYVLVERPVMRWRSRAKLTPVDTESVSPNLSV